MYREAEESFRKGVDCAPRDEVCVFKKCTEKPALQLALQVTHTHTHTHTHTLAGTAAGVARSQDDALRALER